MYGTYCRGAGNREAVVEDAHVFDKIVCRRCTQRPAARHLVRRKICLGPIVHEAHGMAYPGRVGNVYDFALLRGVAVHVVGTQCISTPISEGLPRILALGQAVMGQDQRAWKCNGSSCWRHLASGVSGPWRLELPLLEG